MSTAFPLVAAPNFLDLVRINSTPLLVYRPAEVGYRYQLLKTALPYVHHHFAIKSLPIIPVIETIRDLNGYFDIATNGEIDLLRKAQVAPDRCIHTHPIKRIQDINYALEYGVNHFVVENPAEILKFKGFGAQVVLILRVAFENKLAACNLSAKFGCAKQDCRSLIKLAQSLDLTIGGISFHVGSQMPSSKIHQEAIDWANDLYLELEEEGVCFRLLDIGGGFPARYTSQDIALATFLAEIKLPLDRFHSNFPDCQILSEPGRCLAAPAMTLITQIVGKKYKNGQHWYYIDDGVYGSFSGQIYDHQQNTVAPLVVDATKPLYSSVVAGPTCDSIDIIDSQAMLPELAIGDYLITRNIGAYSMASASDFNFVPRANLLTFAG
jgi:ornithine decarboxylase